METASITGSLVESLIKPKEEEIETPKEDLSPEEFGSRLSMLGKKDKQFRERETALEKRIRELEEREAKLSKYQGFEDINEENAVDFLRGKNIPLEKVQEKWLSQLDDSDLDPIQKQLKELKAELAKKDSDYKRMMDETLSERDKKASEQELDRQSQQYNAQLKEFISGKGEEFDLITTFGAEDEVFKVIKDVYLKTAENGTPKLLKFDEACKLYEDSLADKVKTMLKSKKVQSLLGNSESDPFAQLLGQKTIDDSFSQTAASSPDYKTQAEREKAAAKLFESMRG